MNQKHKFSDYFYNGITYCGVFLAVAIFAIECFFFGMDFFSKEHNQYLGIITYMILPPILILGLILIPVGALRKRRRVQQGVVSRAPQLIHIDFTQATHRNAVFVFLLGTMVFLLMTAVGSYKAFHYTESVEFCGKTCHTVMEPQHSMYMKSPHARVKCVDCHIGAGADWYVRSKLSGARQVYHTIKGDYSKPIPTPVHNLRPAKETCEQCHWPGKFFSSIEMKKTYYPTNVAEPSKWLIRMLLRVGREDNEDYGIHAHMYLDNEIYYAAEDEKRQNITWVKSVRKDGKEVIYRSAGSKFESTDPTDIEMRKMDCMDCHNRPSHHFEAPFEIVNNAIRSGKIDPTIPSIKAKIMEALSEKYNSVDEAHKKIESSLRDHYQGKEADYYSNNRESVEKAIEVAKDLYKGYFFPKMQARWDAYPDHIGHLWSPGCFRCHDGEHKSDTGKAISKDCNICHTIIEQGPADNLQKSSDGLEFVHPFEDDGLWKEMNCVNCHTGN